MKKIRINELARDLEIKANLILDLLPELGVTEKKTHSSSIDEDVAEKLRLRFGGASYKPRANGAGAALEEPEVEEPEALHEEEEAVFPEKTEAPAEQAEEKVSPAGEAAATHTAPELVQEEKVRPAPRMPIRPPLASGLRPAAPAAPSPVAPSVQAAQPAAPARPLPGTPPVQATPAAPTADEQETAEPVVVQTAAPPAARPTPPTVRPLPTQGPRPGQVLSGPRAPFPGGLSAPPVPPGTPIARPTPGIRQAPPPRPATYTPPARPAGPVSHTAGSPGAPRPAGTPLAGQPAARPVVPPNPALEKRIRAAAPPPPATPGTPAPRPAPPARPPASPVPGQPIYRGTIRPGQPLVGRGPDGRGSAIPQRPGLPPQRPGGPRPMHPVSRPGMLAPGAAPPVVEQPRRPGDNRRRTDNRRQFEQEEKVLRPTRRETPAGPPPISREITISEGITVKELSEKLDVKANFVIKKLVDRGIFANINQTLDANLAINIAREFGASTSTVSYEEETRQVTEEAQEEKDQLKRAPVVTIMGHVDHGKTSLLDSIRLANVAEKEAGGITQHIGAYQVVQDGQKIVFIDTPGHEAFTRMRSRGAKVTDIVVLVVAADDGVMPQTLEAIDHAKAAKVPIIVAINKIDKPGAQADRIKQQLSDRGLLAEDWGGDTVMVPVSAKTKEGIPLLLEMILLVAEVQELRANPDRPAMGSVLEAKLDRGRGPVATVLVRNGTLHVGDYFICGQVFGKVRALINDRGEPVRDAEPSTPVEVLGLDTLPEAGDSFQVVTDTAKAKQIVMYRENKARETAMAKTGRLTLEQFHKQMAAGEVKELPIILKADVGGSAEVLTDTLQKLSTDKIRIRVLHSGVGAINESDVLLASASNAIIVGFNVRPERNAASLAEQEKVDIRLHTIIYNLTDEIKLAMTGLLSPVYKETFKGKADVKETFRVTKVGMVAGCFVTDGTITRDCQLRLLRDNVVVHTGKIGSLRRFKDDVSEVRAGQECGIVIENFSDVKTGDVIEAFTTERLAADIGTAGKTA